MDGSGAAKRYGLLYDGLLDPLWFSRVLFSIVPFSTALKRLWVWLESTDGPCKSTFSSWITFLASRISFLVRFFTSCQGHSKPGSLAHPLSVCTGHPTKEEGVHQTVVQKELTRGSPWGTAYLWKCNHWDNKDTLATAVCCVCLSGGLAGPLEQGQSREVWRTPATEQASINNSWAMGITTSTAQCTGVKLMGFFSISDVAAMTRDVNAQNKVGDALSRLCGKYNEVWLILGRKGRTERTARVLSLTQHALRCSLRHILPET